MDVQRRDQILDLVIAGNSSQLADPAFVSELKSWLRFNERAAAGSRDGLFSAASGNPRLPTWIGPKMFDFFFTKDSENAKLAEQVRSSPGLIAFIAPSDNRAGWAAAGRAYQRFALQATVDGLKHAFVNQAVEVPDVRRELRSLLGAGERRPSLLVRFGVGPPMPRSLRRSVQDVLVTSAFGHGFQAARPPRPARKSHIASVRRSVSQGPGSIRLGQRCENLARRVACGSRRVMNSFKSALSPDHSDQAAA
jgi:hypothetical protein